VLTVARKDRIRPLGLADALAIARAEPQSVLLVNTRSNRAAIQLPTASLMLDDGAIEHRVRLLRPPTSCASVSTPLPKPTGSRPTGNCSANSGRRKSPRFRIHHQHLPYRHRPAADLAAAA
jgi:hypothetical protein